MNFTSILPILLVSIAAQEKAFGTTELTAILTAENTRVNCGKTPEEISKAVEFLVDLAFSEQNALVKQLTAKTAAAK